jgi:flagellar biosynthesis/type III secretory pathway protein FliH
MATSDGESCSAEDRALTAWEMQPWGDRDDDDGNPWGAFERAVETTRRRFVDRYQEAFRAGFRAGQEHGKPVLMSSGSYRDGFAKGVEAAGAADSPLGVELSKIRDRLNALELMHEGQPEKTTQWEKAIEGRLSALEKQDRDGYTRGFKRGHEAAELGEPLPEWRSSINKRLSVVEQSVGAPEANMLAKALEQMRGRLSALEDKLRLQEPIG